MTTIKNGIITTDFNSTEDIAYSVTLQVDGKLVVAGDNANTNGDSNFALVRYNTNGSLDSSFGVGGKITTQVSGYLHDHASSVITQTDGKLVIAGYTNTSWGNLFTLVRYNTNGSLDTNFGGSFYGKITTSISNSYSTTDAAYSAIAQPDGKLVVAGAANMGYNNSDFALVRYNANGSLDTSFDGNGILTTDFASNNDIAYSVIIQPDGKLVAAGIGVSNIALARYNTDGSLDTTFNGNGKVTTTADWTMGAKSIIIQPDGKLVAAYSSNDSNNYLSFALVRYNANGSLDTTFGNNGKVLTDFFSLTDWANSVIIQPDGKLVAAGFSTNSSGRDFALVRYNTNGSLDTTFDGDGKVTTDFNSNRDEANSVIIQPDGKLVVVGSSTNTNGNSDFAIVRYNTDGSLDTTFNGTSISPVLNITATDADKIESNSPFTFAINRTGDLSNISTVNYAVSVGTASANDFTNSVLPSGIVSFAANEASKVISIPIVNDSVVEPDETFNVILSSPSGATLGMSTAIGIIRNDDVTIIHTLTGTANNDSLIGTTASDSMVGLAGNDTLSGLAGNDSLDGGLGIDTALYTGVRANFTVQRAATGFTFTVTDKTGAEGVDTLSNIEKIKFNDNTEIRLDISTTPGQAYRIYRAAFDRTPDASGLGFWIDAMDKGTSLETVANGFVNSNEFLMMYGLNPSPETFLTKLYNNVLHRAYDQSGFDFWLGTMKSGANSQAVVLTQFSESPENQDATIGTIFNGIEYTPYFTL